MHCHICDADSDTVVMERGEFSPCAECQSVIFDCLQGYPDIIDEEVDETVLVDFDDPMEYPIYVAEEDQQV